MSSKQLAVSSQAVPMSSLLLEVVNLFSSIKKKTLAEFAIVDSLEKNVTPVKRVRQTAVDVPTDVSLARLLTARLKCQDAFNTATVAQALEMCGVPQTETVFDKLMRNEGWPREIYTNASDQLPRFFIFDPASSGNALFSVDDVDLSSAPKAVLLEQIDQVMQTFVLSLEDELFKEQSEAYGVSPEALSASGAGMSDLPDDGLVLWKSIEHAVTEHCPPTFTVHSFIQGVNALSESDKDELMEEVNKAAHHHCFGQQNEVTHRESFERN